MDYTKDHKSKVNSLLMEKWGYGKKDEAAEGSEESDEGPKQGYQGPGELQQIFNPSGEGKGNIEEIEVEDLEGAEDAEDAEQQPSDKMSAGDFKTKSIDQAKMGSESGMDPKENAIISQLIDILKVAAKEGNITSGNINTLLNKVADEAKKIGADPSNKKPKFMKETEYDFEEEEPLVNVDPAGYSPSADVPASMMSELSKVIQEELSAVLGEAAGMWDTPPPPNPTPQRSGGGMPPKHSPAKKGEKYSVVGGGTGLGSLEGYGEGEFLPDVESQKWMANKLDKIYKPYGQGKAGMSHIPGANPSGMINHQGELYGKDWSEQAGDMLDATSTNSDDPWLDIEQAPYAKPVEGPITMPKSPREPRKPTWVPSGPKKMFGRPGYTPVSEQLKQIIIQELAVVLLEKEDPIEPAEIPNYIAGLKSQAAGSETSAGIAMSTLQAIVGMAAENPQLAAAAAMAAQALESIPKEAETAARDAMKV